jgi:hypothetical protein
MFYEQSQAPVHWLLLGRASGHSREELTLYLDLISDGASDVDAFEKAFGVAPKEADELVVDYLNGSHHAVPIPLSSFDHQSPEVRVDVKSRDRISLALGQLAVALEDGEQAEGLFEAAIAANHDNVRAHSGLGAALGLQGQVDSAQPHLLRALELDPGDAENELGYAEFLHQKALLQDSDEERRGLLQRARRHYVRSYKHVREQLPCTR